MIYQNQIKAKESKEQLDKENALLKEYNSALEKENFSRNQERKALQDEIQRLSKFEKEYKAGTTKKVNIYQSREYIDIKQLYSEVKAKYDSLIIQYSNLSSKLSSTEYNNTSNHERQKAKLSEIIKTNQTKIQILQGKIAAYQKQISDSRFKQESSSLTITRQYQSSIARIEQLQTQLRSRYQYIAKMQNDAMIKEEQMGQFKRQIASYVAKIDNLSQELSKIQRSHKVQTIRYVEKQEVPILRSKLQQLNSVNGSLVHEVSSLRQENRNQLEHIRDLERRICILEETNVNLEKELRSLIQSKKSASRLMSAQDDSALKQAINALKQQLIQVRTFNQIVRQQNDQLYAQLQESRNIHNCGKCHHGKQIHKSRSKSPIRGAVQQKIIKTKISESSFPYQRASNGFGSHLSHTHSHNHTTKSRLSSPTVSNDRYNDIQRKIQMLQNENQVLKQQLVYEV